MEMLRMLISSLMPYLHPKSSHGWPVLCTDPPAVSRIRRATTLPLILLLTATTVPAAFAQEPEPQPPAFEDHVSVGYVLVPVVVRAGAGYAKNLDQDDFRVLVDDRPIKVDSFERRAEAPASVVFLQDLSGSMAN